MRGNSVMRSSICASSTVPVRMFSRHCERYGSIRRLPSNGAFRPLRPFASQPIGSGIRQPIITISSPSSQHAIVWYMKNGSVSNQRTSLPSP